MAKYRPLLRDMTDVFAADTGSWCQVRQKANSKLEPVSEVLEGDAPIPEAVRAFLRALEEQVFRPLYQAAPEDRWEALQDVLCNRFEDVMREAPRRDAESRTDDQPNGIELLIQTLMNSEPDDDSDLSDILDEGRKYLRRRRAILERRPALLEPKDCSETVRRYACESHTAANGFFLALFAYAASDLLVREMGYQSSSDFWHFIFYVIERGGADQYLLLRAAENEIIDEEEEATLVEAGEMTEEGRRMEEEAHRAWLDIHAK